MTRLVVRTIDEKAFMEVVKKQIAIREVGTMVEQKLVVLRFVMESHFILNKV